MSDEQYNLIKTLTESFSFNNLLKILTAITTKVDDGIVQIYAAALTLSWMDEESLERYLKEMKDNE